MFSILLVFYLPLHCRCAAQVQNLLLASAPGICGHIVLHSSNGILHRKSDSGGAEEVCEEPGKES